MASGIETKIALDGGAFEKGVKADIIQPLEDAEETIERFGKAGDRSGEQIERALQDAARESDELKGDIKETADSIERNFKSAYASMKADSQQATTSAKQGFQEIKTEAIQNASETFSSFDGSARSLVDGLQGTFGGLIASLGPLLGPAGVLAAVAGAAGIGLITSALDGSEQQAEEFRAKVSELTDQLINSGVIGRRSFEDMVEDVHDLATETDESKTNLEDLQKIAETLDRPFEDVVNAYTAGGSALQDLIDKTQELKDANADAATGPFQTPTQGQLEYAELLYDQLELLKGQKDAIDQATDAQTLYYASGVSQMEAKAQQIEQVNSAYDEQASSIDAFLNKETGIFDTAAYITAMQQREQALQDYQDALASANLSDQAKAFLTSQGADAAASFLAGYQAATPAQQAELNRIWTEAAKENSGTYAASVQQEFNGSGPLQAPEVQYDPSGDASAYRSSIQNYFRRNPVQVPLVATDQYGRKY